MSFLKARTQSWARSAVYILGICLALSVVSYPALSQGLLESRLCRQAHQELAEHLEENEYPSESQTVFFQRLKDDGTVILTKIKDLAWASTKQLSTAFTPQGDPRVPIYFLGSKIASKLGFKIYTDPKYPFQLIMEVPGANLLGSHIFEINQVLKARGLEPIAYLPVKADILTSKEILDLSLSGTGDTLLQFPYSDSNSNAPHEITFHIGALAYPHKFFKRAHQITRHTSNVAELLKARASEFGKEAGTIRRIADQLITERTHEIDVALADILGLLSELKQASPGATYREIWKALDSLRPDTFEELQLRLDFLARPSLTPINSVMKRIRTMTQANATQSEWIFKTEFRIIEDFFANFGAPIQLSKESIQKLEVLLKKYNKEHAKDDGWIRTASPKRWLKEFMLGLDKRLEQISSALDEVQTP